MWKIWTIAACLVLIFTLQARSQATLDIGSDAPPITVSKWLKGEPVSQFEEGKVYIMEFWATWCGPCIANIPHLSELQKKYPEVVMISTNIWEEDVAGVEPFFKQLEPQIAYRVAMDDVSKNPRGEMSLAWLDSIGRSTIPTAIIVNKHKKVMWIGHPARMENVLKKIIADQYDLETAKADYAKQKALEAEMQTIQMEFATKIYPLIQSKDFEGIDKAMVDLTANHPTIKSSIQQLHFVLMLQGKKYDKAYAVADEVLGKAVEEDSEVLTALATLIAVSPGLENRDLDRAMKYAEKSLELKKDDAPTLNILARIHADKGNLAKAIEYQEKAVSKTAGEEKKLYEEILEKYKSEKK